MKRETWKMLLRGGVSILIFLLIMLALYLVFDHFGITDITQEEMQAYLQSWGIWAPLLFILISFLQVSVIRLPSTITILAGNYLFGPVSFFYSYIGILAGSLVAFALGKWIGRKYVDWVVGSHEKVDEWLEKLKNKSNVILFFMFLLPGFPDDMLCSIAGITPLGFIGFTLMQLISRALAIGATLLLFSGEVIPFEGWGIAVFAVIAVIALAVFIVCVRYADKINAFTGKLIKKLFKTKDKETSPEEAKSRDDIEKFSE